MICWYHKLRYNYYIFRANEEIENVDEQHKKDNLTLRAELRRIQIRNQSLEEELIRKENENKELTQICDELIANQWN